MKVLKLSLLVFVKLPRRAQRVNFSRRLKTRGETFRTFENNPRSFGMSVTHKFSVIFSKHCQCCHHAPVVGLPCLPSHIEHKNLKKDRSTEGPHRLKKRFKLTVLLFKYGSEIISVQFCRVLFNSFSVFLPNRSHKC